MLLTLIRHGDVQGRTQVLRGRSDPLLSAHGTQQLQQAVDSVTPQITALACSPMQRCALFAQQQADARNIPLHRIDDLREIDFGDWEELTLAEAQANNSRSYAQFQHDTGNWHAPNGEAYKAFRQRVQRGLQHLCAIETKHMLAITHGGVIRAILAEVLDLTPASVARFGIPLGGICQLWIEDESRYSQKISGSLLRLHWLDSTCG